MTKLMCVTGCGPASTIACWEDIQESHIMWSFSLIAMANNTDSCGTQVPAIATVFAVITSIEQVSDMAPDLHQFFSFMTIVLRWWYWLANDAQDIVTTKHANKRSIQIYLSSGGICNLILRVNKVNTQMLTPSFTSTKTLMKICYLQQQYIHIHMLRAEFCFGIEFWTDRKSVV